MRALAPSGSGISFINYVSDTSYMVKHAYMYAVNGGGTSVADFNNDGKEDVVFISNYGEIQLYENQGNLKFRLVSDSGLEAKDWCTALIAGDINGDGLVDLYVCKTAFEHSKATRNNLLFINKGNFKFEERSKEWGVDCEGNSTGAAFFDFDLDGDLDLYVVNGPYTFINQLSYLVQPIGRFYGTDVLYENVGGKMVDVTEKMGLPKENAFGLSVVAADIDMDGWIDLYVANDFIYEDFIFLNKEGKRFELASKRMMGHMSFYSMGSDVNDFNNDGLPDIVSVDMLQDDLRKFKWESTINTYDFYEGVAEIGGHTQYIRNCLQLNRGDGTFSEIAELAGVAATDWSWSCLFVDLDNDGWKDLLITNGIRYKGNIDYHIFETQQNRLAQKKFIDKPIPFEPKPGQNFGPSIDNRSNINLIDYPKEVLANHVFRNNGDLTFKQMRDAWGMSEIVNSNGASYADLDNDGDLELVVNNHNDTSLIYRNYSRELKKHNYLRFKAKGEQLNSDLLGTKVFVYSQTGIQYQEIMRSRGFQSTSQAIAHFGLGESLSVDSVVAISPYGRKKLVLINPKVNTLYTLDFSAATEVFNYAKPVARFFQPIDFPKGPLFTHKENYHQDFKREPLLTQMYSRLGPGLAVGDVNGDGIDDFFVGGASGQAGALLLQQTDGTFLPSNSKPWEQHSEQEDMGCLLFDLDQDGDLDLYVASGGNENLLEEGLYRDRLYVNDGKGNFTYTADQLVGVNASASCVVGGDFDGDGDIDLFVGGRILTGKYPLPPRSYLLRNDGGKLIDVTEKIAPGLEKIGLVSAALWTDFDNDSDLDLIVVGQWMPISVFENQKGKFVDVTSKLGLNATTGWWNSITGADLDDDGDTDYLLGNLGLNTRLKASSTEPLSVYAIDIDNNTSLDAITFMYNEGINQPIHRYAKITDQILLFRRKFLKVKSYAFADLDLVIPSDVRQNAYTRKAEVLYSAILVNKGKGKFELNSLPMIAQKAPIYGMQVGDYNSDGYLDLLLVGNNYTFEIETGRADAFRGLLMLGDGKLGFNPIEPVEAGFRILGDAKALVRILRPDGSEAYLASQNNSEVLAFQPLKVGFENLNPNTGPSSGQTSSSKSKRKNEVYWGDGYLSQSSRASKTTPNRVP